MHLTASHLVVNRNPIVKIGQVVSQVSLRNWCLERITLINVGKFDEELLDFKGCEL